YLTDISDYHEMNRVWASYFSGDRPPARAVIGVARLPGTPVVISAVAVAGSARARAVRPHGYAPQSAVALAIRAEDRLYISGLLGRRADTNRLPADSGGQVKLALDHLRIAFKAARKRAVDLNITTVYITEALDLAAAEKRLRAELPGGYTLVRTAALPLSSNIEITAISAPDLRVQSASGVAEEILRGFGSLKRAVVSDAYVDNGEAFQTVDQACVAGFGPVRPARTTVQPLAAGAAKTDQIVIVSVK
ncbi:MAG TPA: RidA family protein, partial [Bryobacteraceae bacterium]|nr:RidA family protein [Bryobacteraceae bacterium]